MIDKKLERTTLTLSQSWQRLGEFDYSPYSVRGQVNEEMRESISELRANLLTLQKYGVNIQGL